MKNHLLYLFFSLALLSSCNTSKEIIYFQDVAVNSPETVAPPQDITVQPKDQISIVVSSKDPELAALFNLTRVQQRVGSTGLNNSNNNGEIWFFVTFGGKICCNEIKSESDILLLTI